MIIIKIKTKKELGGQLPISWTREMEYLYGRIVATQKIKDPTYGIRYETIRQKTGNYWSILKEETKYTINPKSKKAKKIIKNYEKTKEKRDKIWKTYFEKKRLNI